MATLLASTSICQASEAGRRLPSTGITITALNSGQSLDLMLIPIRSTKGPRQVIPRNALNSIEVEFCKQPQVTPERTAP